MASLQSQLPCLHKSAASSKLGQCSFTGLRLSGLRFCRKESTDTLSHSPQKCSTITPVASAAATTDAAVDLAIPSLNDLPNFAFINSHGRIMPSVDPNTQASVFAILDKNKKVQYIGFSKDLRNSLRILIGRRPELCYYYKVFNLAVFDQTVMLKTREQWMSELGTTPEGNADLTQRQYWEQPINAGSISERGKTAAAKAKAKAMLQMLADRGVTEEMVYDPKLLEEGKCDILPTAQPQGDLDQGNESNSETEVKVKAVSIKVPSGGTIDYEIAYEMKFKTNGGWMYDIAITRDDTLTRHRVIVGSFFPESVNMPEDEFLETIMGFLLYKRIPRHTEGLIETNTFPINYFAVSKVCQFFSDLEDWFPAKLPDNFWRFSRTELYGAQIDPPPSELGPDEKVSIYDE
ncbi:hypothetical protein KP509_36G003400 [Ceratopteris richardii]|nr:hypothetical protein KP509_36G003400 [Ceratopteris richardii]